jgi:tRNA pseudouridine38-40 synthase
MRVALGIEYDGTAYVGWQSQKSGTGVQAVVEEAISKVADEPIKVTCAGRTDSGVHASAQVVHFDTAAARKDRGWMLGINSHLPEDVNTNWARTVDEDFHARFSATSRTYRYLVLNRLARSGLYSRRAWWIYEPLDEKLMRDGAIALKGKHDFSAFRAAGCQASTPIREIQDIQLERNGEWLLLTITANAFLQHMVRNVMGTLVAIGKGDRPVEWLTEVLQGRNRQESGIAAPPCGLTLIGVQYPQQFDIPNGQEQAALILQ